MAELTDSHRSAARRLLEQECARSASEDWADAAGRVFRIVSDQLSPVLGAVGVRALLARGVKLTRGEFHCLAGISMPAEPGDEDEQVAQRIAAALSKVDRERGLEAATHLYAAFFALLTNLIGESLTWRIVQPAFTEDDGTSKETE